MASLQAIDDIFWVGTLDKDLRVFDIVMYTENGTSYNSYIVKGDKKTVLFETSKYKFFDSYRKNIEEVCPVSSIDYIVVNHTEPDHTGVLERLLEQAPNAEVLASATGITFLKEIINKPFKHRVVTDKDTVDIGGKTLKFIMAPMLHWPDSMFTYIPEKKALFSCDSFGCHYADERVFNDKMTGDFDAAYKYYFDNIMGPYANPHMLKALDKIKDLDIEFIGNGHGPVIRTDVQRYLDMYRQWSTPVARSEKKVVIAYVSAYGYTKQLAEKIKEGILSEGIKDITTFDLVVDDCDTAAAAVAQSDAFLLGSPTLIGDALPPVYAMINGLNPVIHRGKLATAFGSYGWSGEGVPNLLARFALLKLNVPLEGFRVRLKPTEKDLQMAVEYGAEYAREILSK